MEKIKITYTAIDGTKISSTYCPKMDMTLNDEGSIHRFIKGAFIAAGWSVENVEEYFGKDE